LLGTSESVLVENGETLLDIAYRHRLGYQAVERLNPEVDPWIPVPGTVVHLPTRYILSDADEQGFVINLPEMRLYDYTVKRGTEVFALAIGDEASPSLIGEFNVGAKRKDPVWHVPASIREEKPDLPAEVPAGPDKPLGSRWITVGRTSYGIHGTNVRWSIGREARHGCLRLYEEEIVRLFDRVREATRLQIVHQTAKWGRDGDRVYLEVHPDLYGLRRDRLAELDIARALGLLEVLDLELVLRALEEARGYPVPVATHPRREARRAYRTTTVGHPRATDRPSSESGVLAWVASRVARPLLGRSRERNRRTAGRREETTMVSQVRDWMTLKPAVVREDGAAIEAFDSMVERGIRHLPVVDAGNRVIGVLTIDDLRAAFPFDVQRNRPLDPHDRDQARGLCVSDAMTWAPHTVHPEQTLEHAVRVLSDNRIGCLPVVDAREQLVGILSETDALHALAAQLHSGAAPAPRAVDPESVLDELWAERGRIVEQIAKWQRTERALLQESHDPGDLADRATDAGAVAGLEPLSARAERRLRAIELAIERAEHGRLGICERCHGRIPRTRLRAVPEATLCVRCARTAADGASA
jgi:L,D-transpeptidase ErfK/SrfK